MEGWRWRGGRWRGGRWRGGRWKGGGKCIAGLKLQSRWNQYLADDVYDSILGWNIRLNYFNLVLSEYNSIVFIKLDLKNSIQSAKPIALQSK